MQVGGQLLIELSQKSQKALNYFFKKHTNTSQQVMNEWAGAGLIHHLTGAPGSTNVTGTVK